MAERDDEQRLVDEALAWAEDCDGLDVNAIICGFPAKVIVDSSELQVRDHLGVVVLSITREGYAIAPHYAPTELLPLFKRGILKTAP